jgi:hypothetical protein
VLRSKQINAPVLKAKQVIEPELPAKQINADWADHPDQSDRRDYHEIS